MIATTKMQSSSTVSRFAVFGLGNPGEAFVHTRHNIGAFAVERFARRFFNAELRNDVAMTTAARVRAQTTRRFLKTNDLRNVDLFLVQPTTFMNRSGAGTSLRLRVRWRWLRGCAAVRGFVDYYKIPVRNILVVSDDIDLPLSRVRVRRRGSSGGQKGVESVIRHLGSSQFDRLRIGIGQPSVGRSLTDHVMAKFASHEESALEHGLLLADRALQAWLMHGSVQAANLVNGAPGLVDADDE